MWRAQRKAANTLLTPKNADNQLSIQRAEAMQLLFDLLHDPQVGVFPQILLLHSRCRKELYKSHLSYRLFEHYVDAVWHTMPSL
jgi:hypothetical protein